MNSPPAGPRTGCRTVRAEASTAADDAGTAGCAYPSRSAVPAPPWDITTQYAIAILYQAQHDELARLRAKAAELDALLALHRLAGITPAGTA